MSERENFEEAASRLGFNLTMAEHETGEYHYQVTQDAWDIWQEATYAAAREHGGAEVVERMSIGRASRAGIRFEDREIYCRGWNDCLESHPPQSQGVPEFDYNHPTYCEIIERITNATHELLEAAGHDAEYLLDMDEALEANIFKNIVMVATELSGNSTPAAPQADEWVKCADRMPTEADEDERGDVWLYENGVVCAARNLKACPRLSGPLKWKPTGLTRPQPPEQGEE